MHSLIEHILNKFDFDDYKWIKSANITVSHWVRVKCEFGCEDYGLGACPPNTPSVNDCMQFFKEYKDALLIRTSTVADKEDYPRAWSKETTEKLLQLEKEVFLKGFHKAFLLNQTCCTTCKECSGNRLNCMDKKSSRPSPEAFAVDVYQTVRNSGMQVNVIADKKALINRYAILLIN